MSMFAEPHWAALPFALALVAAAAWDATRNRIPNGLVALALPLALIAAGAVGGLGTLPSALLAGLIMFVIGFMAFAVGAVGGGDAKLLAVTALAVGWSGLLPFLLAFGAIGGLLAVAVIVRRRAGVEATVMTMDLAKHAATMGRTGHRARLGDEGRLTVPYGVAIAAAALLTMFTNYAEWLLG